jgi:hypothetical protein
MHTGQKHDYLGVDMEFNDNGTLEASMIPYLKNVISKFPKTITGRSETSAADHLFTIKDRKEAKPRLSRGLGVQFVNGEAKLKIGLKNRNDYSELDIDEQLRG